MTTQADTAVVQPVVTVRYLGAVPAQAVVTYGREARGRASPAVFQMFRRAHTKRSQQHQL